MSIFKAIILSIVQGLTEFLPVSSSGHLVLLQKIFGIEQNMLLFDIILHLGTLFAVIIVYRKSILDIIKNPLGKKMKFLVVGTIPTVIIALLFKDFFENAFSGNLLFVGFLVTAIFLLIASYIDTKNANNKEISFAKISTMGVFQGLALLPGISRSGSTVTSALILGVKKDEALEYSFLLSIPIIIASLLYEIIFSNQVITQISAWPMILGFVFSAIFGILSIKFMIKLVKSNSYKYFAIYLFALSVFLALNQFVFHLF